MHIDIQARKFRLTRSLRRHVERRLRFVADSRYQDIMRVLVRLSDLNGPRSGEDKCCLIQLRLPGQADIVVADTRGDLYAAINRATERVRQTLSRKLTRQKHKFNSRSGSCGIGLLAAE